MLVRRHLWMDPELRFRRPGPSTLLLFLVLTPLYVEAAPIGGQAAKMHRILSAETAAADAAQETSVPSESVEQPPLNDEPAPAIAGTHAIAVATAAPQVSAIEDPVVVRPVVTVETSIETSAPAVPRVANAAYLPLGGALPLRFAEARRWPAPLPLPPVETAPEPVVEVAQAEPVVPPPTPETVQEPPPEPEPARPVLTADLVLGYMGNLNPPASALEARFIPAIPGARKPTEITSVSTP